MARLQFRRLGNLYLIALGGIALVIIFSQFLIQFSIRNQRDDARIINVAGRQRMLSQKIAKLSLKIKQKTAFDSSSHSELSEALDLWKRSHEGLQNGDPVTGLSGNNSIQIVDMFSRIQPHYESIFRSASAILSQKTGDVIDNHVATILANEAAFLDGMNTIVFQYDLEASEKVINLRNTELLLFFGSLLIIALELIFVFRPLAKNIQRTVAELQTSETSAKKMTRELSKLHEELEKSYQDLEAVNITPESHSLYATINRQGKFTFISSKFRNLMEYESSRQLSSFEQLLGHSGYERHFIKGISQLFEQKRNWSGELRLINEPGDLIWLDTFLIPTTLSSGDLKMIARNITELKEAKNRSREINKERIDQSIKEQQYRSSLILEGQEEERKRLSRELHDSIGQMLSALKLQQESLLPTSKHMKIKLEGIKELTKKAIQEVRRVSFSLAPLSLDDFGLVVAVGKFCVDINGLSQLNISFVNETNFITRLEPKIEINLYRIIQEAINNAIKYCKGSNVIVKFMHNVRSLSITIADDGKGFDYEELASSGYFETPGHGLFNMKERTSYIGATFDVETSSDFGTSILITLPIQTK